jgi:hypothetical protein
MTDSVSSGGEPRVLDLTSEKADQNQAAPTVKTLEEKREDTRRAVAISLLAGLAVVIFGWTLVAVFGDNGDIAAANDVLKTAFVGLLGLTGTVVGFYFGGAGRN